MGGIKGLFQLAKSYRLIHVFVVYLSSGAVILEVTDTLQDNAILIPGVFAYVLWLLLAGLPLALVLTWMIRKRVKRSESGEMVESGSDLKVVEKKGELHNLPESITRFIGREKETQELCSLVEDNRLVTITGEGGCGKTRISLQIAREFLDKFNDGVWFVDLAPLEDPLLLPQEIANTLSILEEQGKLIATTLKEQIKEKKFILLLDNCEHLVDATADLVQELLHSSPDLKVLATSREALKISGEVLWKVPSLTLPEITDQVNIESLASSEAIRLFLDRAENCKPGFRLNQQNALSIAQICQKLEGIPLAIELAAARISHMEPKMILDRIRDRFQLLTSDSRSLGSRQKTLKATIDWSYDLLPEKEKLLFERLSVFSGGFLVETVEEVCEGDPIEKEEVLDMLSKLVDKSMVTIKSRKEGSVRYGMLETLREYASQKLTGRGEKEQMDERHFDYYLSLADRAFEERLDHPTEWADKLEAEHDEYLKAIKWAEKDPQKYLQICGGLGWFWEARSHYQTSLQHLKAALSGNLDKTSYRARALLAFGMMGMWLPELAGEASVSLQEALDIWMKVGNMREAGQLHLYLGTMKVFQDEREAVMEHFKEAHSIFSSLGDPRLMVMGKFGMGFGYICSFEPQKGEPFIVEALEEAINYEMKREIGMCRHAYADIALLSKDYAASLERYRAALKAIMEAGDQGQAVYELQGVAMSLAGESNYHDAIMLNSAALAQSEHLGISLVSVGFWAHCLDETIGKAIKELGVVAVEQAEKEGRAMGFEKASQYALKAPSL